MFDEREEEYSTKKGEYILVWQSTKYKKAKEKAIELIEKKNMDLQEAAEKVAQKK